MINFPLLPPQASTVAPHVDALMLFALGVTIFFSVLIAALIVFFSTKYHHRRAADRKDPPTFHLGLEIAWTGIPLLIVMTMFIWGSGLFLHIRRPPDNALEMFVVAKQWMWKLQHPEGKREINELHIPVGYPIRLTMISQDVIHSLFVPDFRVKQDVLPGRYTSLWFEAAHPGTYHLFCSQYCGAAHSAMIGHVIAMAPADYERWLSAAPTNSASGAVGAPDAAMVAAGAKLFSNLRCMDCHHADNSGRGPSLKGLPDRRVVLDNGRGVNADDAYLRESILLSNAKIVRGYQAIMPAFQGVVDEDEILQLIAYIKSLKGAS
jgi:cytochrome c oxidase subunit 2